MTLIEELRLLNTAITSLEKLRDDCSVTMREAGVKWKDVVLVDRIFAGILCAEQENVDSETGHDMVRLFMIERGLVAHDQPTTP